MNSINKLMRTSFLKTSFLKICMTVIITLLLVLISVKRKHMQVIITNVYSDTIIDIMDDVEPSLDSIFFIETTHTLGLNRTIDAEINYRKACAVESASKTHPNNAIYILYTTQVRHPHPSKLNDRRYAALKQVYSLKNVHIRSMNVSRFVQGSPIEPLFISGKFQTSLYPHVHLSDILRQVVLWRFGGTYLDMDLVIMKSFTDLGRNYVSIESNEDTNKVNSATMHLENQGIGREITEACMIELCASFIGDGWAENGPYLVTRVINRLCNTKNISELKSPTDCRGLTSVPFWTFNPYGWGQWDAPFRQDNLEQGLEDVENSYAIHLYSHSSDPVKVWKNDSEVLYGVLAEKYCPESYKNSEDYF